MRDDDARCAVDAREAVRRLADQEALFRSPPAEQEVVTRIVWADVVLKNNEAWLIAELQDAGRPHHTLRAPISPAQIVSLVRSGSETLLKLAER